MYGKFAYLSDNNPREDFIFSLNCETEDDARMIVDDLNSTLSSSHVEFIGLTKKPSSYEFGAYSKVEKIYKDRKHGV